MIINPYAFGGSGGGGAATYSDEVLADSPLFYYELEETSGSTASDSSGNGNDGAVTGADLNVSGQVGSAISYDGTDDYLDAMSLGNSVAAFTIELWAKVANGTGGGFGSTHLWGVVDSVGDDDLIQLAVESDGTLIYRERTNGSFTTDTDGSVAIDDGAWHHIVVTASAGDTIRIYVDGTEDVNRAAQSGGWDLGAQSLYFGARNLRGTADGFYDHDQDEIAVYLSELSATRVQAHYDAGFSPSALSGLALWFDADAITGLSDTDPVATWADESGNGRDATQATGSKQPTYRTGIQNGKPAVRFDDTAEQRLATSAFASALSQPNTIFVVANHFAGGNSRGYLIDGIASGNRHAFARGLDSDNGEFGLFAGAGSAGNVNGAPVSLPTGMDYWTAVFNGASSLIRRNGAAYSSGDPGSHSMSGLSIAAAHSDGFGWLPGDICEIVIYDRALTTTERDEVESYLADKWGL